MEKTTVLKRLKRSSCIFAIIGILLIGYGFSKIIFYENPEYSFQQSINAYVEGDAYNFIINGTYFTAYCVLGIGSVICAIITSVAYLYISMKKEPVVLKDGGSQRVEEKLPEL